jgi:hypothetical protein
MRWAGYVACMRKVRREFKISVENLTGNDTLRYSNIDGRIIRVLRRILKKWNVKLWTG